MHGLLNTDIQCECANLILLFEHLWSWSDDMSPLHCLLVFLCVHMVTPHLNITCHNMVQKHITLSNVLQHIFQHHWQAMLCMRVQVCVCAHARMWLHTHTPVCTILPLIKFQSQRINGLIYLLMHGILDSHNILRISNTVSLSWSWQVHCALPALPKCMETSHHRCFWYTCSTRTAHMCLWISACWHPSTVRNWFTTLWSCLDGFTTWCAFYKLHCHVVHTSYWHGQLYCSAQVNVAVFTKSNVKVTICRVNESGNSHINLALGRVRGEGREVTAWVIRRGPHYAAPLHPSFIHSECGYWNVSQNVEKPSFVYADFMHFTPIMNIYWYRHQRILGRDTSPHPVAT